MGKGGGGGVCAKKKHTKNTADEWTTDHLKQTYGCISTLEMKA